MNVRQFFLDYIPLEAQAIFGGLTSLITANSSIASLIMPIVRHANIVEEDQVLLVAMAIAFIPAAVFASADSHCHRTVGELINKATDEEKNEAKDEPLTHFQSIMTALHYSHDILEGMFPWLTLNSTFSTLGWYKETNYSQTLISVGLFAAATVGTFQEVKNTRTGFKIKNHKAGKIPSTGAAPECKDNGVEISEPGCFNRCFDNRPSIV